jgi:hypothetical protein
MPADHLELLDRPMRDRQIGMLPLSGVTERFGAEGLYRRFALEINELELEEQYVCNRALYVATVLHADDRYKGLPYASHLLRTAIRLRRDYDVTDAEVLSAMLLRDSVEDHADELVAAASGILPESAEDTEVTGLTFTALSVVPVTICLLSPGNDYPALGARKSPQAKAVRSKNGKNQKCLQCQSFAIFYFSID